MRYPKILNLGDPGLEDLFKGPVFVEEKIDGSQFRAWFDDASELHFGSKGVNYSDERLPDRMFLPAIASAQHHLDLHNGSIRNVLFVFEFLAERQQNALTYGRIPKDHLVLLDVCEKGVWLTPPLKRAWAERFGFEVVPLMAAGVFKSVKELEALLEKTSFLDGATIEGIVVKTTRAFINWITWPAPHCLANSSVKNSAS